ncbi:hypothetical protein [Patulibacter minatonensis]|uniref:hypothetical protein n=1 Tax=Patulibacter minatonensis TaxID=298163 RepID=UPI00047CF9E4|nr:hypothetical protein [Patulibacter minatonensis]
MRPGPQHQELTARAAPARPMVGGGPRRTTTRPAASRRLAEVRRVLVADHARHPGGPVAPGTGSAPATRRAPALAAVRTALTGRAVGSRAAG